MKRYEPIADKGYISADQMEQYRTNVRRGRGSVKVDQANVAAAKLTLGYTEIHSPIAGRIGRILIQPGNLVKANDTNALRRHQPDRADLRQLRAAGHAARSACSSAQAQAPLSVDATVVGVAKPIEGKVAFVDNAVDPTTDTVKLRAEFANPEHLLWPGQFVSVSLTLGQDRERDRRAGSRGAERPRWHATCSSSRPISTPSSARSTVARMVENQAVIEKGLAAGETVVLDGQSRVENGAALKITGDTKVADDVQVTGAKP